LAWNLENDRLYANLQVKLRGLAIHAKNSTGPGSGGHCPQPDHLFQREKGSSIFVGQFRRFEPNNDALAIALEPQSSRWDNYQG